MNIGVERAPIPLATTAETVYQIEALAGTLRLNLFFIFSKSKISLFYSYCFLAKLLYDAKREICSVISVFFLQKTIEIGIESDIIKKQDSFLKQED